VAFTFPYPTLGTVVRPVGQGCTICVHQLYCPALYWYRRYTFKDQEPPNGRACNSWSNNPADQIVTMPTADDLKEEDYMTVQGVGSEANRCGIGQTTGGSKQSEGI
jgi:hypothetical protein